MKRTDESVKLPVANPGSSFYVSWALVYAPLVCNEPAPVAVAAATALSVGLLTAQIPMPTPACPLVAVDVAIDRLVTDVQLVRDLLWTLIKQQIVLHAVPGHLRDGQTIA